jgi:hypothetical protein
MASKKTFTAYGHSDVVIDRFNNLVALYNDSSLLDMINHALCDEEIVGICEYIEDLHHEQRATDRAREERARERNNQQAEATKRLQFIKEDVTKIINALPPSVLDDNHDGVPILTLLSNIEIATDLNDNEPDNWKLGAIISAVPESNNTEVVTATEITESEKYLAVKKLWDDVQNNDTLWCPNFDEYYKHTFSDKTEPNKQEVAEYIIKQLNSIDVDGETMEYILEKVGMTDQMLRQLIMNNPESDTKNLLEEKILLNESLIDSFHDRGRNVHLLPENGDYVLSVAPEKAEYIPTTDKKTMGSKVVNLISLMNKYNLYQIDDEVGLAVDEVMKDIVVVTPAKTPFELAKEQIALQEKIQRDSNVTIVTCGNCGNVVLHEIGLEEIQCFSCTMVMATEDCPDLWYEGVENNYK